MNTALANIRIVLVGTSHPGNIGSAARAMKVMGLDRLYLVAPEAPFPSSRATALATSGDDILERAIVVEELLDAIAGCGLVLGTTARLRSLPLPVLDPRAAATRSLAEASSHEIAIVFGREKSGLSNDETRLCHYLVNIPTSKEYHSLNLAQAVQVVTYELHMAALSALPGEIDPPDWQPQPPERMEVYFQRLEQSLLAIGFLNPEQPKRLMQRLRRLYQRARPDENELNILNGIVSATLDLTRERRAKKDQ
ncbi:MAG: RNA methyltransferase [Wenzhouxiangella sp.]|nr:RNA methyltransferase [Wenzhouxiangella sp.]TVR93436.1 MAG: RNA methyltransferase [Wenzhouxiangellaceae bacterium]